MVFLSVTCEGQASLLCFRANALLSPLNSLSAGADFLSNGLGAAGAAR